MSLKDTIKKYNKELNFVIITGFVVGFCFISVFYSYSVIFITENRNDDDDIANSKKMIFAYSIMELIGKLSASLCKCARKRKRLFLFGYFLIIIGWSALWVAYLTEKFYFAKIGGALISYASGCAIYPALYTYFGDIPPASLMGFFYASKSILDTLLNLGSPFLFGVSSPLSNFQNYFPIFIGIIILMFIFSVYYYQETGGLKKPDIYKLMRGQFKEKPHSGKTKIVPK